jgi:RimJ/RimL family protein N-acetyltransferase
MLIGTRIILRPLEVQDALTIVPWFHDPEVNQFLPPDFCLKALMEETVIQHLYKRKPPSEIAFGIILKVDKALVGVVGIDRIDWVSRSGRTSILIGVKKYWNRGLGTEAKTLLIEYGFLELNLHSLYAEVIASNERTVAACAKQGYRHCGRLRDAYYKNGRFLDMVLMDLVRDEWIQFRKEADKKVMEESKATEVQEMPPT